MFAQLIVHEIRILFSETKRNYHNLLYCRIEEQMNESNHQQREDNEANNNMQMSVESSGLIQSFIYSERWLKTEQKQNK